MNMTDKIFRGIGAAFIVVVILGWFIYHKVAYGGDNKEQNTTTATRVFKDGVGTEILTVGQKPSKRVYVNPLGKPYQFNLVFGAMRDDVPFICIFNGGNENGGWETYFPARRDWERLNFKFIDYPGRSVYVSFKVPEGVPDSQIYYTISRK